MRLDAAILHNRRAEHGSIQRGRGFLLLYGEGVVVPPVTENAKAGAYRMDARPMPPVIHRIFRVAKYELLKNRSETYRTNISWGGGTRA